MVEPLKCHVCGKEVDKLLRFDTKYWVCTDCFTWLNVEVDNLLAEAVDLELEDYQSGNDSY